MASNRLSLLRDYVNTALNLRIKSQIYIFRPEGKAVQRKVKRLEFHRSNNWRCVIL